MSNVYKEALNVSLDEFQTVLENGIPQEISEQLVNLIHSGVEQSDAEEACINAFALDEVNIKATAILCIGHIARIYGSLNSSSVLTILRASCRVC